MRKISRIDLSGISPDLVEENQRPNEPLETPGYKKAKEILDMATNKTASASHLTSPATLPQIEKLLKERSEGDSDKLDTATRFGGYTAAGAGAGSFLGKTTNLARNVFAKGLRRHLGVRPPVTGASKLELATTLGGGIIGLSEANRRKKLKEQPSVDKTASPGIQLRAAKETGKHSTRTGENVGKTQQQQIRERLMGKKFVRNEKVAGMHNDGEELDFAKATFLSREDMKAIADSMFGDQAVEARRKERELMSKLLVQAPYAQTMAPVLQKESGLKEIGQWARNTSPIMGPVTSGLRQAAGKVVDMQPGIKKRVAGTALEGATRVINKDKAISEKLGLIPKPKPVELKQKVFGLDDPELPADIREMMLKKTSSAPSFVAEQSIPYNIRRKEYLQYLKDKAKSPKSDAKDSAISAGLLGAAMGGVAGLTHGSTKGTSLSSAGAGTAIGALLGALMGVLSAHIENGEIDQAKEILRTNGVDKALADAIMSKLMTDKAIESSRRQTKDMINESRRERRHMELIDAIKKKTASVHDIAPNTAMFFEKVSKPMGLTEAQSRYPELLTVKTAAGRSAGVPTHSPVGSRRAAFPGSGPTPMQSQGSGGSA